MTPGTAAPASPRTSTTSSGLGRRRSLGSTGRPSVDYRSGPDYAAYRAGKYDEAEAVAYGRTLEDFEAIGLRKDADLAIDRAVVSVLLFSRGEKVVCCAEDVLLAFCLRHDLSGSEFMSVLRDATLHLAKVRLAFWGVADPARETYCPECRQVIGLPEGTGHSQWCYTHPARVARCPQ